MKPLSQARDDIFGGLVSAAIAIPLAMGYGMFAFSSLGENYFADGALAGLVTASIAPGRLGEVKVAIRGGSEAFHAYAMDPKDAIPRGTRVFVVEYFPPRTIVVSLA